MEGTQCLMVAACFFQGNAVTDHIDDIGAIQEIVDKTLWDQSGHISVQTVCLAFQSYHSFFTSGNFREVVRQDSF